MKTLRQIWTIAFRECGIMREQPIYWISLVVFPIVVIVFFTSLMAQGVPTDMPVGVVDLDQTATSRAMIRRLDAFQSSQVVAQYQNMNEAREAIQRNEIYAFLYIPKGMTRGLGTNTQPKLSFYYSSTTLVAGSLLFKDLKTILALGSAAVGQAKLSALGRTPRQIRTTLQPIAIDLHMLQNPWANYNVYLSTVMVPGLLMLFVFLLTPYSLGIEIKFQRSREWMALADNRAWVALAGKLLPQLVVSLLMFYAFEFYIYYVQDFPHSGGFLPILLCGILSLLAAQGFGIFVFGLMPGLRMAMSVCSLWAVVSLSIAGATFPVFAMSPMLEAVAQLFPLRHYYMLYQLCVLNGFPLSAAWLNLLALLLFCFLPFVSLWNIKRAMLLYTYLP